MIGETISGLIPQLYDERRQALGESADADMSRSGQCKHLSHDMMTMLHARGIEAFREYHEGQHGTWHYFLAHAPLDRAPAIDDLITDLNPWQGLDGTTPTGHLHGPRIDVMEQMLRAGIPPYIVALRGLGTLITRHARVR